MNLIRSIRKRTAWLKGYRQGTPNSVPASAASSPPTAASPSAQQVQNWITQGRWFTVDQMEKLVGGPDELQCPICEHRGPTDSFTVFESYCQFGGGRLVRHECGRCGLVFGPQKMFRLSAEELSHEYRTLYEFYSEGDTTENEIRTFHAMQPRRDGVYLNFGSGGGWNSSVTQLRAQGWNILGFEPYAGGQMSEAVIRSFEQLETMQFDGIMSNNVLEHLVDPLTTFRLWRKLLKGPAPVMAHSTPCYKYLYAITRFHLYFFTGRSLEEICQRTGFHGQWAIQDGEFLCYRFTPAQDSAKRAA